MTTTSINYASSANALTISLASLASSSTWVGGCESSEIDNTTNKYTDVQVQGKIRVGTTPTASTFIKVYAWGSDTSLATTALDVLDGTDSAETITSVGVRDSMLKQIAAMSVDATTSDRDYYFGCDSLRRFFGGNMPRFWGLFVAHNTGVNLNSTGGNHVIKWTGVKYDSA